MTDALGNHSSYCQYRINEVCWRGIVRQYGSGIEGSRECKYRPKVSSSRAFRGKHRGGNTFNQVLHLEMRHVLYNWPDTTTPWSYSVKRRHSATCTFCVSQEYQIIKIYAGGLRQVHPHSHRVKANISCVSLVVSGYHLYIYLQIGTCRHA